MTVVAPTTTPESADGVSVEPRRRFTRASLFGAIPAFLVFAWMSTGGFHLGQWLPTADFYDAQARSLLHFGLSIPESVLGIEGFVMDGGTYMYQGPAPALFHLPFVALFGDNLDGRLSRAAVLCAFLIVLVVGCRLHWRIRTAIRGPQTPIGRWEFVGIAAFTFLAFAGSTLLFIGGRSYVFHESIMWGLAFTFVTFDLLLAFLDRGKPWLLAAASLATTLAFLSRASLGLGAVAALGVVALGQLVRWLRGRSSPDATRAPVGRWAWIEGRALPTPRAVAGAVLACAVPVVIYCAINVVKFDSLVSVPWDRQQYSLIVSDRQEFLDHTNNSFFGAQFAPTTLAHYLRPDGVAFSGVFPWIEAPQHDDVIGDAVFDTIEPTASMTASMPAIVVLAAVGVVIVLRSRRRRPAVLTLTAPLIGALVCGVAVFPYGYIAQRFLGDLFPALFLFGAVGLHGLVLNLGGARWERWRLPAVVALVVLGVFTFWANFALALNYQRLAGASVDERVAASYVDFQQDVAGVYSDDSLVDVRQGRSLPRAGKPGDFFIVGDCDGLYYTDGSTPNEFIYTGWRPVERTNDAGRFVFDATIAEQPSGTRVPILVSGSPEQPNVLELEYLPDDKAVIQFRGEAVPLVPRPFDIDPETTYRIDIAADRHLDLLTVQVDDRIVTSTVYKSDDSDFTYGRNTIGADTGARFTGTLRPVELSNAVCRTLRERSGLPRIRSTDSGGASG